MKLNFNQASHSLYTLRDWIRFLATEFEKYDLYYGHGTDNSVDEAITLVFQALNLPIMGDKRLMAARVLPHEVEKITEWAIRRIEKREPLPYISGIAYLGPLSFVVDQNVLIPRSPIAEYLEAIASSGEMAPHTILDLCSGSGCLAILAAYYFPESQVDAIDISSAALEVAERNKARHQVGERLHLIESDLFGAIKNKNKQYDLIISNPPYVDENDFNNMPPEFRHEPQLGLTAGQDGLDIVRRILNEAAHYLTPTGNLVVELGNSADTLQALYPDLPLTWLSFDQGGQGVFSISKADLKGGI